MPEYVDYAEYYDYDHLMINDIPFYIDYAKAMGEPILELACGTGRVLIPIAETKMRIHGLDLSKNMLAVAIRKVKERSLSDFVNLKHADMADFNLKQKNFSMVFVAARSFMHLFTQDKQLACLRCVHRHLRSEGLFILDLYSPDFGKLSQEPESDFKVRREFTLPNGHRVVRLDRFVSIDLPNQINHYEVMFKEYDATGRLLRTRLIPMDTRYTFSFELQLLLEKAGFKVQSIFSDYQKRPYDGKGEIIVVAQK